MTKECQTGKENYSPFWSFGHEFVEYYYQTEGGERFTCIAGDIEAARGKRDNWLKEKKGKNEG